MIERVALSLAEREAIIERGLSTFMEVGEQLLAIRADGLYQEEYGTFERYCRERWGFKRAHAYRMIEAAETVAQLSPNGDIALPKNEAQARELARIPDPAERAEVWQRVTERHGERVTAQHIRELRSEESPPYDAGAPLLSVMDVETGEIVRPRSRNGVEPATDPEAVEAQRRERATRNFAHDLAGLWSLLMGEPERLIEDWIPGGNPLATQAPHLSFLWTADGVRQVANALNRLAAAIEAQGGTLA